MILHIYIWHKQRNDEIIKILYQNVFFFYPLGVLPFELIVDQTTKYNENARMGLPYDVIYRLAQRHSNDRNQVDIDRYLNDLGNDRTWYMK